MKRFYLSLQLRLRIAGASMRGDDYWKVAILFIGLPLATIAISLFGLSSTTSEVEARWWVVGALFGGFMLVINSVMLAAYKNPEKYLNETDMPVEQHRASKILKRSLPLLVIFGVVSKCTA